MAAVVSTLIELDDRGIAWITGTKVKVIEIATDKLAHGSSPEEMHLQYPYLSLAQIYAALAYYYEHQTEFEAEILRQAERAKAWADAAKDSSHTVAAQGAGLVAVSFVTLIGECECLRNASVQEQSVLQVPPSGIMTRYYPALLNCSNKHAMPQRVRSMRS
jgi:uncharacterized protein (DUF433 family)